MPQCCTPAFGLMLQGTWDPSHLLLSASLALPIIFFTLSSPGEGGGGGRRRRKRHWGGGDSCAANTHLWYSARALPRADAMPKRHAALEWTEASASIGSACHPYGAILRAGSMPSPPHICRDTAITSPAFSLAKSPTLRRRISNAGADLRSAIRACALARSVAQPLLSCATPTDMPALGRLAVPRRMPHISPATVFAPAGAAFLAFIPSMQGALAHASLPLPQRFARARATCQPTSPR